MSNFFVYGRVRQPTSVGMIVTTADIFTASGVRQSTPTSAVIVTTNPTFGGVQSVVAQLNGSLLVSWNAASGPNGPYAYDIYIQESSNVNVFNSSNLVMRDADLSNYLFELANGNLLRAGFTYYVGVKARDPFGNISTNTTVMSAVSSGVAPGRPLTPSDISTVVAAIWDEVASSHTVAGSFGKFLDAQVSSRSTQSSVNNIPTNPLLTNDSRLNTLDANISSRATQTSVDNVNTKIGTPVSSVSADLGAVQSKVDTIDSKIGTPVISISSDIASVQVDTNSIDSKVDVAVSTRSTQTSVDGINTKIGTPASTVSADIAAVKSDSGAIKTQTDKISFDGSNFVNARTKVNEDKTGYALSSLSEDSVVDKVWDESKSGHNSSGTFGESNQTVISAGRVANLDNLDVAVSTRASQTSVNEIPTNPLLDDDVRLDTLDVAISTRASQSSVDNIQNNTDFVGIVPVILLLPQTGSKSYPLYARLFNSTGAPIDPDSNDIQITVKDALGTILDGPSSMTRTDLGQYEYDYTVNSTDTEQGLFVFFDYLKSGVPFNQVRATEVQEFESKLDTLLARITEERAENLDYLDISVASRASQASVSDIPTNPLLDDDVRLDNLDASITSRATQSSVNTINSKVGSPAATLAADIAAVKSDTGTTNSRVDVTLSTRSTQTSVDTANTKLGTPVTSVSADIAAVKTDTASIDNKVDVTLSTRASQASVDAVPTAEENADAVWEENVNDHATGTTTARTLKDAKIFSQIDL